MENLVRLSKADDLLIKKSTLYKWSAKKTNSEIFIKLGGTVFVDLDRLEELIERGRKSHNQVVGGVE